MLIHWEMCSAWYLFLFSSCFEHCYCHCNFHSFEPLYCFSLTWLWLWLYLLLHLGVLVSSDSVSPCIEEKVPLHLIHLLAIANVHFQAKILCMIVVHVS